jgi:polysaccharide pyruvyl transferase WcaK-like protein
MARVVSQLLKAGYFVSLIWSSSDDEAAIPEILDRLDSESKVRVTHQISIATIKSWKDIVAALVDVDFLIASRLHSEILGFLTQKPTIAISFDSKVDWLM